MPDSIGINILVFLVGAGIIGFGGYKLALLADQLADRTGMGEAITGTIVLGLITALPGIGATANTAMAGLASMTASNALGGIAIQTAFLAVADIVYRKANLEHAAASMPNIVQTAILIPLLTIIGQSFLGPDIQWFGLHPFSLLLVVTAIIGVVLTSRSNKFPMWQPERTSETVHDLPNKRYQDASLVRLLYKLIFYGAIVLVAGLKTADAAGKLTEPTGISQSLMGGIFLAVATSQPELATTITSVRAGALTLAVSNVVGGNFFDAMFLSIGDVFYRDGSLYHAASITNREPFLAGLCGLLNIVLLIGLLMRQKKGPGKIGVESALLFFLYLSGMVTMHFFM